MDDTQELSVEQVQRLTNLAEDAERELALGVQAQSNRAFNLGCTLWFIPGALVIVAAFILSKGNWVIAFLLAVLVALLAAGFALVSATNTKTKAADRLFLEITLPQLSKDLAESNLSQLDFIRITRQVLPSDALLHRQLDQQEPVDPSDPNTADRKPTQ